jgi:hypothetical protein
LGKLPKLSLVHKFSVLKEIEIESISTLAPDIISFILIGLCVAVLIKIQSLEMKELNEYPNYIYIYFLHLVAPSISMFGITSSLFSKKELRRTVKEEIQNLVHDIRDR